MSDLHSRDKPENVAEETYGDILNEAIPPPEEGVDEAVSIDEVSEESISPPEEEADEAENFDGISEEAITPHEDNSKEVSKPKKSRAKAYFKIFRTVCSSLIVAAAVVVLVVYFLFPVMRIYGSSMSSTLVDGDIVIAHKTTKLDRGDICAFYYGNQMLCKRVIGLAGDSIEIKTDGTVYVNGEELDEPYLKGKSLGDCDIEFPYIVPDGNYFVLGDNRRVSIDSRHDAIGCIPEEQMVGELVFCILPLPSFGTIK